MKYSLYYKQTWIPIYVKQLREAKDYETKKAIRDNIYKNIQLSTKEKDEIWSEINRRLVKEVI